MSGPCEGGNVWGCICICKQDVGKGGNDLAIGMQEIFLHIICNR